MKEHLTRDREWKYNTTERKLNNLQDLIDCREQTKYGDAIIVKAPVDARIIEQAKAAERRLKRLKMAKYSFDLLDEIIEEMMRDKKTIMEMMAELDINDADIYASQTRIAKR